MVDSVVENDHPGGKPDRERAGGTRCRLDYNLIAHRPQVEDVCDTCGGALKTRTDDNPEALAVRLAAYHGETRPVLEIFQRKEFVSTIDASRSVDAVQADIRASFGIAG